MDYDLRGLTVLPGWIDAHVHITWIFGMDGKNGGTEGTTQEDAYHVPARNASGGVELMQTLRSLGWLVDFIVGSLLWSIAIVLAAFLAPFALVGFFPLADLLQLIVSVRFRTGSSGIGQAGGGRFSQSSINFVLWNHSSRTPSRQGSRNWAPFLSSS